MQQDYQGPAAEGQMRILAFPSVRTYTWQPQQDITTYELALCMPLMAVGTTPDGWTQMNWMYDHLPAEAQRHWSVGGKAEARLREFRAARRPKPPSDKELALEALQFVDEKLKGHLPLHNHCNAIHTIRRALEALND